MALNQGTKEIQKNNALSLTWNVKLHYHIRVMNNNINNNKNINNNNNMLYI